jgi:hypothetical protein
MGLENVYQMSDSVTKFFEMGGYITNHTNERKTDKIVDNVIKRFKDRSTIGIEKYGTTLYDSPDGFYGFLNHLQEELMDATLYIEKLKQQK